MTDYLEIDIRLRSRQATEKAPEKEPEQLPDPEQEQVLALLADFGFNGFREEEGRILAYMPARSFSAENFRSFLSRHGLDVKIASHTIKTLPDRNWNSEWEQNYSPVQISENCQVRAPFHPSPAGIEHDLVILPGMTFGTAHHETTRLMMELMLDINWEGKKVLDLGCGTGILAILAEKLGAGDILAVDNDPRACRNARENAGLNGCRHIRVRHSEPGDLKEQSFDALLANINLNVLLEEMKYLVPGLSNKGIAMLSGFYRDDLKILDAAALEHGLSLSGKRTLNRWMVAVYRKAD